MTAEEKAKVTGQEISIDHGISYRCGPCHGCNRYEREGRILDHFVIEIRFRLGNQAIQLCRDCAADLAGMINKALKTL